MLAPDAATTTAALQHSISSAAVITVYAGALRYAVAPLLDESFPDWFDPVKTTISASVANAASWMDDLCIDATTGIPRMVVSFATTFDATTDELNNLQTEITMAGTATEAQRQRATDLVTQLHTAAVRNRSALDVIDGRLKSLAGLMQTDHDNLAAADTLIATNLPNGGTISSKITADLGDDFLSIEPNGPCMVSVSLRSDVDVNIKRMAGDHLELVPFLVAQKLVANATADNAKATAAFSEVRATWSLMEGLTQSAIDDISTAADDKVLAVLRDAELDAARDVWTHLSTVASSLTRAN